jgi:4-amino-4-deoxy-L-arabinose transferase-like glycosyltransferase
VKPSLYLIIAIIASALFLPFLGSVHLFDWDEINFAESAREMLVTGDYARVQINFKPFWEKPPLFIWMQALSMKIFGINEYAARFPNAITGIITLLVLFFVGKKHFDKKMGLLWAMVYAGSFLPHLYFKSGIIDPVFNLFIFLGIYFIYKSSIEKFASGKYKNSAVAGLFIGLAVITKGPVGLLVAGLSILVYLLILFLKRRNHLREKDSSPLQANVYIGRYNNPFTIKEALVFAGVCALVAFGWFGIETVKNGPWFLQEFIVYQIRLFKTQDAGHGGPFIYHFVVLYLGCFPASIFIFKAFKKDLADNEDQSILKLWMVICFLVVLILFSIVKTKIVHYSSFCYFPLTFFAAYSIWKMLAGNLIEKLYRVQILIIGVLIGLLFAAFPLFLQHKKSLLEKYAFLIKDDFALANLEAEIPMSGFEWIPGILYIFVILYIYFSNRNNYQKISVLFLSTCVLIQFALYFLVPKIEAFSQRAAIDFFESKKDENAILDVHGYKSYAHLFYGKRMPENALYSEAQHIWDPLPKPVYLVTKINNSDLDQVKGFIKIGQKNGFVFYKKQ